jgi:hypothetical protein
VKQRLGGTVVKKEDGRYSSEAKGGTRYSGEVKGW